MTTPDNNSTGLEFPTAEALTEALSERYEGLGKSKIYEMKRIIGQYFDGEKLTKALTAEQLAMMDELNEHRKAGGQLDRFAPAAIAIAEDMGQVAISDFGPPELIDLGARFAAVGEAPEIDPEEIEAVMRAAAAQAVSQQMSISQLAEVYRNRPDLMPEEFREALAKAKKQALRVVQPEVRANQILQAVAVRLQLPQAA